MSDFDPNQPYNDLPDLPPPAETVESTAILKKCINARVALAELKQAAEEILSRELEGLLGGRLAHLEEKDRRAIERWARATFGRLMHPSVSAVKRMAFEGLDGRDR